jgi:NAD(P)-dependent dehydrogenase (short-subunit alcohol dehydrogenase family)
MLKDKTILITGASDGIGKCIAERFASYGATLVLLGRSQAKLEKICDSIEEKSLNKVIIQPMDFAKASEPEYKVLAESMADQFSCLDGLIHNAGTLGARTSIEFYPAESWNETMQVNISATFLLTKALLGCLNNSADARILFTSSSVGRKGKANWGAYAVSKFALEGLMQTLADELKNTSNIRVNSINPGGVRTAMRRAAYPAENPDSQPKPDVLMPLFLYLFTDAARVIHGETLNFRDFNPLNYLKQSIKP